MHRLALSALVALVLTGCEAKASEPLSRTITVSMPPAHLRIADFDANLDLKVVFSPDPNRACREADRRAGIMESKPSLACTVTTEGTPYIIVPSDACAAHYKALIQHELGHIIGLVLDEDTSDHVGWIPQRVTCGEGARPMVIL